MKKISGIIVPLVTPFLKGKIDKKSLKKLVLHVKNVDGIFISGFMGEYWRLKPKDKKEIIKIVRKNFKKPIFVGISDKDPLYSVDFYVILPPKNKKDLFCYYQKCFTAKNRPIILYNNPHINGFNLPISFVKKVKGQIYGIKDSSGNLKYLKSLIKLGINVYQGDESKILKALKLGVKGTVCGIANVFPELPTGLFRNFGKNPKKAEELQREINQIRATYINNAISGIKKIVVNLKLGRRDKISSSSSFPSETR